MAILNANLIKLQSRASTKDEAIDEAVGLLVNEGKIDQRYGAAMRERETVANTFLGNGIAIPHGVPSARDLIHDTAISVVQVPAGVDWGNGDQARLIVAIAAKSDEHLEILANLTGVVGDEVLAEKLIATKDKQEILAALTGAEAQGAEAPITSTTPPAPLEGFPESFEAVITGAHGLHARPATNLVNLAKGYSSQIRVSFGDKVADAKSLISLLKLGAGHGAAIRVSAKGEDAQAALAALQQAIATGLGDEDEGEAPTAAEDTVSTGTSTKRTWEGPALEGVAASPGLAVAPVLQFGREKLVYSETAENSEYERASLTKAIETAREQLEELYADVSKSSGVKHAEIFKAHQEFLEDSDLLSAVDALISSGKSAPAAWDAEINAQADQLAAMDDALLAARATDMRDVGRRVLKLLAERVEASSNLPTEPCIIVAEDLTPSETAELDPSLIRGLAMAAGGPTSHTSIIARSLDIPAVVGVGKSIFDLPEGKTILLDGTQGQVVTSPSEADLKAGQAAISAREDERDAQKRDRFKPALMRDGSRIEVVANIGEASEAAKAVDAGGEGVGLLRTEILFVNRESEPTEDEQAATYSQMARALNGLPIIIRTLDVGGDKEIPYLTMPQEDNPFLGERGIRFCLARPELFRSQLRAIYRASAHGCVRIMFPMVSQLSELLEAKKIAEEVRLEVGADPVEIGIMIEVPSAVAMASVFAQHVDFFSIGTNDLTQYTLAMDRLHPLLAKQADGLDPAVLRFIDQTVRAADAAGIWVGACGGIAGDPLGATLLTGLGLKELSMSIPTIPEIKALLRSQSLADNKRLAQKALEQSSAADVRALMGGTP